MKWDHTYEECQRGGDYIHLGIRYKNRKHCGWCGDIKSKHINHDKKTIRKERTKKKEPPPVSKKSSGSERKVQELQFETPSKQLITLREVFRAIQKI